MFFTYVIILAFSPALTAFFCFVPCIHPCCLHERERKEAFCLQRQEREGGVYFADVIIVTLSLASTALPVVSFHLRLLSARNKKRRGALFALFFFTFSLA